MKNGKIEAAVREFNRAKELDPSFAPAHIGMGMAYGFQRKFEKALTALDTAGNNINGKEERIDLLTARMRIYLMGREKMDPGWLSVIETNFKEARNLAPNNPELYFFMGLAYKMANDYNKAADQFSKVLRLDKGYVEEAERELKSYY
jgi:lipoprotein NlpI